MIKSLRAKLALWHASVLGLVLVILSFGAYFAAKRMLEQRMDAVLLSTLDDTVEALLRQPVDMSNPAAIERVLDNLHYTNRTIALLDSNGVLLGEKKALGDRQLRLPERIGEARDRPRYYSLPESRPDSDDSRRGVLKRFGNSKGATYIALVYQSTESVEDQLDLLRDVSLLLVPLAIVLAAAGGWFLARRSLAPVAAMAQSARQITAQNLDERLPVLHPRDEIGSLARTFNELLERLNAAFTQQRQFMADASHELRTPLSVVRTAAEVTLQQSQRGEGEYREALETVKQQAGRLSSIVDNMFALARADMGQLSLNAANLYLDEVLDEAVRAASFLAVRKGIKVESQLGGEAPYQGDEGLLRQMVLSLLDNAIKYTPAGGEVKVILERTPDRYAIRISDTGPGIPNRDQPLIFDRFFRSDKARTGTDGNGSGAGLGLSIARSIAELHHGQLMLQKSDTSGSTFVVLLPQS